MENVGYYLEEGLKHFDTIGKIQKALRHVMKGKFRGLDPSLSLSYGTCLFGMCGFSASVEVKYVSNHGLRLAASVNHAFVYSYIPIKVSATASLTIGEKYKLGVGPLEARIPLIRTGVKGYASVGHDGINIGGEVEVFGAALAGGGLHGSVDRDGIRLSAGFQTLGSAVEVDARASWTDGLEMQAALTLPILGTFVFGIRIPNPFLWFYPGPSRRYLN